VSTTPGVCSKIDLISAATAIRRAGIRSINFRDEGLQHGRSRRSFRHLDRRAESFRDRQQPLAHASGHLVALRRAFALRHEVHLQIGEVRSAPQK
jgi:hypothetical protein